jgi:SAM-dependent methyltransferase
MTSWRLRIFIKVALSKLPFNYKVWSHIGFFRHGSMDECSYAWNVLKKHTSVLRSEEWKGLELGPGDGLLSAFLAPSFGSSGLTLVDVGDFASKEWDLYKSKMYNFSLTNPFLSLVNFSNIKNTEEALKFVKSYYYTEGLVTLKKLQSSSFDIIYSQAVLEHIRQNQFEIMMKECHRLLKLDGVMSHDVDFKDHLGGGLNNMRFSTTLWEKDWFAQNSGFYTNRIRLSEMVLICKRVGFSVRIENKKYWSSLPIKRSKLTPEYRNLSDDDLLISEARLIMRHA